MRTTTALLLAALIAVGCSNEPNPIVEALQVEFDAATDRQQSDFCEYMETSTGLELLSAMAADPDTGYVMGTYPIPNDPVERVETGAALDQLVDINC